MKKNIHMEKGEFERKYIKPAMVRLAHDYTFHRERLSDFEKLLIQSYGFSTSLPDGHEGVSCEQVIKECAEIAESLP